MNVTLHRINLDRQSARTSLMWTGRKAPETATRAALEKVFEP
jgi:hypothetical protein